MNSHTTVSWTRWLPAMQVSDSMNAVLNREAELIDEYQLTPVMDMLAKISEVVAQQRIACRMFGPGNCSLLLHLLQLTPINPISFGLHSERFFISPEITPHCHVDPLHLGLIQSLIDQLDGTGHSIRLFPASNDEMRPYDVSHRIRMTTDPGFEIGKIPLDDIATGATISEGFFLNHSMMRSSEVQGLLRENPIRSLEELALLDRWYMSTALDPECQIPILRLSEALDNDDEANMALTKYFGNTPVTAVYQEDIMNRVSSRCAVPARDWYQYIKICCRKRDLTELREGLLRKADDGDRRANRMNREEIRELLDLIQAVAPQLTCKARGLDAAIPLWRSAYLKTHFPDVFHEVTAQGGGSLQ